MELLQKLEAESEAKETQNEELTQEVVHEVFAQVEHILGLEKVPPIRLFRLLLLRLHTENVTLMQGADVLGIEQHLRFIKTLAIMISDIDNFIEDYENAVKLERDGKVQTKF